MVVNIKSLLASVAALAVVIRTTTQADPQTLCDLKDCQCSNDTATCSFPSQATPFIIDQNVIPRNITKIHISNCRRVNVKTESFFTSHVTKIKFDRVDKIKLEPSAFYAAHSLNLTFANVGNFTVPEKSFSGLKIDRLRFENVTFGRIYAWAFATSKINELLIENSRLAAIESNTFETAILDDVTFRNCVIPELPRDGLSFHRFERIRVVESTIGVIRARACSINIPGDYPPGTIEFENNDIKVIEPAFIKIEIGNSAALDSFKFVSNTVGSLEANAFTSTKCARVLRIENNSFPLVEKQEMGVDATGKHLIGRNSFNCSVQLCLIYYREENRIPLTTPKPNTHAQVLFNNSACLADSVVTDDDLQGFYGRFNNTLDCVRQFMELEAQLVRNKADADLEVYLTDLRNNFEKVLIQRAEQETQADTSSADRDSKAKLDAEQAQATADKLSTCEKKLAECPRGDPQNATNQRPIVSQEEFEKLCRYQINVGQFCTSAYLQTNSTTQNTTTVD